mmetsp:Transcript_6356/g.12628  ORF Transcript_6356/g.12628 Transcript_6356/m.12628 type:complete len:119 (+) Transcript_6356:352-708(+)
MRDRMLLFCALNEDIDALLLGLLSCVSLGLAFLPLFPFLSLCSLNESLQSSEGSLDRQERRRVQSSQLVSQEDFLTEHVKKRAHKRAQRLVVRRRERVPRRERGAGADGAEAKRAFRF